MGLAVIGIGFGRTGTHSLKLAIEHLGFGPCCHSTDPHHLNQGPAFWRRVFDRESIDWDSFFDGYRSTVDSPSCKLYLELATKFPSAKLILTYRDPDAWFASYRDTVLPMIASAHGGKHLSFLFGTAHCDRASMISAYEQHNAAVQQSIPRERLLTYDVNEGWSPLCAFLGVPIPDAPFPRTNARAEFASMVDQALTKLTSPS